MRIALHWDPSPQKGRDDYDVYNTAFFLDTNTLELLRKSFRTLDETADKQPYVKIPVVIDGVAVREIVVYRAHHFLGLPETARGTVY